MFPEDYRIPLAEWLNGALDWVVTNYGSYFEAFSNSLLFFLVKLEAMLLAIPWWVMVLALGALAYHATRQIKVTLLLMAGMVLIGLFGLWDMAMQTLAIMLVSLFLTVLIGIPIGIALSSSSLLRSFVLPLLDIMQTMPSFVYLIPALMLFGLGKVPAILATVIYALPPLIRLTDLGVRLVDPSLIEASKAFGATKRQRLISIQLPLALPNIMQGINQATMMALSMVVIASMIGARGLGEQVLLGIQRLDIGQGAEAGIAIVILAILLDRITQAYGRNVQTYRNRQSGLEQKS